jgi:hypothetical protein
MDAQITPNTERDVDKMKENQAGHRDQYKPDQVEKEYYESLNCFTVPGSGEWTGAGIKIMKTRLFNNGVKIQQLCGQLKQHANGQWYWKFAPSPELKKILIAEKILAKDQFNVMHRG